MTIVWCRAFFPHVLSDIWQSCKHRESIQIGKLLVKIWQLLVLTTIIEKSILNGPKSWKSESNMTSTKKIEFEFYTAFLRYHYFGILTPIQHLNLRRFFLVFISIKEISNSALASKKWFNQKKLKHFIVLIRVCFVRSHFGKMQLWLVEHFFLHK